ncbi:ParB/RepB/Spo0J family partition protein [Thermospira aquatica]|uniref:ParB/RepB/Spo0J family partition protein n=1 Tax=Thermospira aquatica TaxID=2828656 RepID=A0AAX3BFZ1_9SPIR|nr:ParB/RepB/Spo0J family partition protein [Thermospira aquatica]URA10944.1 ParB/RepB/Spo0J family partition protein [Thermospira aquatica]
MAQKHGLGKGMLALVDENMIEEEVYKGNIQMIDVGKILPNKHQPRKFFAEDELKELADSIREKGVIQPILVTDLGNGKYELVAGERRWRAAKMAGLLEIPAIVRDFSEEDKLEIALIENIQRSDLNPIEEALAFKEIMERLHLSQEELAQRIGKNRSSVANTLRLLKLPEIIQQKIIQKELTEGHARVILMLSERDVMIQFADYIIEKGLSVREAEVMVKDFEKKNVSRETLKEKNETVHPLTSLEEKFIQSLGLKVSVTGSIKKGKIEIHYFSQEELEYIYQRLVGKE